MAQTIVAQRFAVQQGVWRKSTHFPQEKNPLKIFHIVPHDIHRKMWITLEFSF
jgi:hypothetical protein